MNMHGCHKDPNSIESLLEKGLTIEEIQKRKGCQRRSIEAAMRVLGITEEDMSEEKRWKMQFIDDWHEMQEKFARFKSCM